MYSGIPLVWSPTGHEKLTLLTDSVGLNSMTGFSVMSWQTSQSKFSEQPFFNNHLKCRYKFNKIETSISRYNIDNRMMDITDLSGLIEDYNVYRLGCQTVTFCCINRVAILMGIFLLLTYTMSLSKTKAQHGKQSFCSLYCSFKSKLNSQNNLLSHLQ